MGWQDSFSHIPLLNEGRGPNQSFCPVQLQTGMTPVDRWHGEHSLRYVKKKKSKTASPRSS